MGFADDANSTASSVSTPGDDLLMGNDEAVEDERMHTEGEEVRSSVCTGLIRATMLTSERPLVAGRRSRTLVLSPPSSCPRRCRVPPRIAHQALHAFEQRCRPVASRRSSLEAREGRADVRFRRGRVRAREGRHRG